MPRKRSEPVTPVNQRRDHPRAETVEGNGPPWLPPVVAGLVTVRFFLPAESAAQGETLWIVLLWLLCGLVWLFDAYRSGDSLRRPDGLDVSVGLLVGGHVISALCVLASEGQKRAALNLLWEWLGIGVALLLLRAVMRQHAHRDQLLRVIMVSGVVLAGLGVWQHFVWYPRIAAQFALVEVLTTAPDDEDPEAMRVRLQKLAELRGELGVSGTMEDSSGRGFQDRVQASTEPIGRFALANTFAGLLLVALFLLAGGLWRCARREQRYGSLWRATGLLVGLLLVAYCLWLTKSRTALAGLLCGIAAAGVLGRRSLFAGRWMPWVLVGGAAMFIALPVAAALTGSLDREVVSEAPKSLRYRLEYWEATARLIADHPWLGVGPGNFRQHYLGYKLPGASEEILDPHNLILDVWANGGVIALVGLVSLFAVAVRRFWYLIPDPPGGRVRSAADGPGRDGPGLPDGQTRPPARLTRVLRQTLLLGGIGTGALLLAAGIRLLQGTALDADWLALGAAWWVTAWMLTLGSPGEWRATVVMAAFAALCVHLTGAGGIAMPAILQVLLILVIALAPVASTSPAESVSARSAGRSRWDRIALPAMLMAGLALTVACVVTAIVPVTNATAATNLARALWRTDGQPLAADRTLLQAAEADTLSPEPWQELSRLRTARWLQTSDPQVFDDAVRALKEAIDRDPHSAGRRRALGQLWSLRYERQPQPEYVESAYEALSQAVERYPHLASAQAELAVAARNANRPAPAVEAAATALRLDDMNRRRGHLDKLLSGGQRAELRQILDGDRAGSENHPDQASGDAELISPPAETAIEIDLPGIAFRMALCDIEWHMPSSCFLVPEPRFGNVGSDRPAPDTEFVVFLLEEP